MKTIGKFLSILFILFALSIFAFFFGREHIPIIGEFYQTILSFITIFYYNNYVHILIEFLFLFLFLVIEYYNIVQKKKEVVASVSSFISTVTLVLLCISTYFIYSYFTSNLCAISEGNIYRCASDLSKNANFWYLISQAGVALSIILGWHNITNLVNPNNTVSTYCKHFVKVFLWVLTIVGIVYVFFYFLSDYSSAPLSIHQWGPPLILSISSTIIVITLVLFISDYAFEATENQATAGMDYEVLKEEATKLIDQKQKFRYGEKQKTVAKKEKKDASVTVGANTKDSVLPIQVQSIENTKQNKGFDANAPEKAILFSSLAKKQETPSSNPALKSFENNHTETPSTNSSMFSPPPQPATQNNPTFQNVFDMYQEPSKPTNAPTNNQEFIPTSKPAPQNENPSIFSAPTNETFQTASPTTTNTFSTLENHINPQPTAPKEEAPMETSPIPEVSNQPVMNTTFQPQNNGSFENNTNQENISLVQPQEQPLGNSISLNTIDPTVPNTTQPEMETTTPIVPSSEDIVSNSMNSNVEPQVESTSNIDLTLQSEPQVSQQDSSMVSTPENTISVPNNSMATPQEQQPENTISLNTIEPTVPNTTQSEVTTKTPIVPIPENATSIPNNSNIEPQVETIPNVNIASSNDTQIPQQETTNLTEANNPFANINPAPAMTETKEIETSVPSSNGIEEPKPIAEDAISQVQTEETSSNPFANIDPTKPNQ